MLHADITDPRGALPVPTLREAIGIRRLVLGILGDRARQLQQVDPGLDDSRAMMLATHAFNATDPTFRALFDLAMAVIAVAEGRRPASTIRRLPAGPFDSPAGR